jgi:hypothetical protein
MEQNKDKAMKLLEQKIQSIVRQALREMGEEAEKRGPDTVDSSEDFKRKYLDVQRELTRPAIDATQVMSKALGFNAKDDSARSHAFKKLHKEKTPDGSGNYEFTSEELGKIKNALQAV